MTVVASLTHNAHPSAKISKAKERPRTDILISVFAPSRLHLLPRWDVTAQVASKSVHWYKQVVAFTIFSNSVAVRHLEL